MIELNSETKKSAKYWQAVAREWETKYPSKLWRAHSDEVNRRLLESWLPKGSIQRLLKTDMFDEAFGDGLYSTLAPRTKMLVGVDTSVLTINLAKLRATGLQTSAADVGSLPFADCVFDVVVSNSTLDHFDSLEELLAGLWELRRVLRDGGQLILTLDNQANPVVAIRNALPFQFLHNLGIIPYYVGATLRPGRLKSILEKMNFEVEDITTIYHFPRIIGVAILAFLEKYTSSRIQQKALRFMLKFECLSKLPTRSLTGYFVAAKLLKNPNCLLGVSDDTTTNTV